MAINTLDASMLAKMFLAGAKKLESKKEEINELNVFPVPDGDTGTNMTLTVMSAAKEVYALKDPDMETVCKSISSGTLRGARGNSGVILSQLFRGMAKVIKGHDKVDIGIISAACDKAVEMAYKAVMQPKEGTILTVAKGIAEKINEIYERGEEDFDVFFKEVIEKGNEVLDHTPELLPVLKEAGVVDSGGAGLMAVVEGIYEGFQGKGIEFSLDEETSQAADEIRLFGEEKKAREYKYLYHTTISIMLDKAFHIQRESEVKKYLNEVGDEVTVSVDEGIVNVGLNTSDPGMVLQKALQYGELIDVAILNRKLADEGALSAKNTEEIKKPAAEGPRKPVGFVAVSAGSGIGEIFKGLGIDCLIEGGQTMNPSTEDMLNAVKTVNADTVFIFPNNKNIILAANQARDLTKDKKIIVIPTKTVPQCISAMIAYMPDASAGDNEASMNEAAGMVKSGSLTYAVRDTSIDGVEIHEHDFMGIGDSGILSNGADIQEVMIAMLDKMCDDTSELISIYYGADVSEEDAEAMKNAVAAHFPSTDIEMTVGAQPVYYYIVSVE